jgi:hypothetical protein
MHDTIPTTEPERLVSGTTWSWNIVDSDHPPSAGWTLSYSFRNATAADKLDVTASPSDDDSTFEVRLTAEQTDLPAGFYRWARYVSNEDGARYRTATGSLVVEPDFAAADTYTTHEQRVLAVIEALIEGRYSDDMEQFSIRGRSVLRMSMAELQKWRGYYRAMVRRQIKGGRMRTVDLHFTTPT